MKESGTTGGFARCGVHSTGMRQPTSIGGGIKDLARACKCDDSLAVVVEEDEEEDSTL